MIGSGLFKTIDILIDTPLKKGKELKVLQSSYVNQVKGLISKELNIDIKNFELYCVETGKILESNKKIEDLVKKNKKD